MFSVFRSPKNPFLSPSRARSFEAIGTFNPSVVKQDDTTHVFYRAMGEPDDLRTPGRGFSTIGYTTHGKDQVCTPGSQIITATEAWDMYGCEDPRATFFEGKWYVFYTALGGFPFGPDNIKAAVAIGTEPDKLTEKHLVTPFNAKAATLFPGRVNGEAVLIVTVHTDYTPEHPRPTIGIARSKNIEDFWNGDFWNEWHKNLEQNAFPDVRRADTEHMEVGATPLLTDKGWLFIYSHIQNYYDEHRRLFGIEALLLDRDDPKRILAKTEFPFLVPEESYERYGMVSNIVFPSGAALHGDTLTVYYGGADTVSASAQLHLPDLLSSMMPESRMAFVKRADDNPILSPDTSHAWESVSVSNAAAVDIDGSVHLLYRAMGEDNISRLGYTRSTDGIHIEVRLDEPAYEPRIPEESHGTEDPRLVRIDETLYLTYTAFDGGQARGTLSSISVDEFLLNDFKWATPRLLTPSITNDKDLAFFSERINGKVTLLHRIDPDICIDSFDQLPPEREVTSSIELMTPRPGMWDAVKVGSCPPPIKVPQGWLLIYHAVAPDFHYRLGAALLSDDAKIVLSRTASPILEPVLPWEKEGIVPNVIFSCGAIVRGDVLYIYYGGADTQIGVATTSLSELLKRLQPKL